MAPSVVQSCRRGGAKGAAPLQALRDRLRFDPSTQAPEWASFLPAQLRPAALNPSAQATGQGVREEVPAHAQSQDSSSGDEEVTGRVWSLSQDARGCRQVQRAMDEADSDEALEALAGELRGHVVDAARCPHANHVLQKLIASLRPQATQFVVDELMQVSIRQMAQHKYGCRILQRLVEHCGALQVRELVEDVLKDISSMSKHSYGNYVVQNILEHGTDEHRRHIVKVLAKDIRLLAAEPYGCAVIAAALTVEDARLGLAQVLLKQPGLLVFMARARHGSVAVMRSLEVLEGAEQDEALRCLRLEDDALRSSKHGREVAEYLDAHASRVLEVACLAGA